MMADAWDVQLDAANPAAAFSRHVLASVESQSYTQVRGSGDYRAGNDLWAPLGVTGLLPPPPPGIFVGVLPWLYDLPIWDYLLK